MNLPSLSARSLAALAVLFSGLSASAHAETISLSANDGSGASSFNSGTNWSDSLAPSAGNDYVNIGFTLRTPNNSLDSFTFEGDSLTIEAAGGNGWLLYKGGNGGTIIVEDLRLLNGGEFRQGGGAGNGIGMTLGGKITLEGTGGVITVGAGNSGGRTATVTASIAGSAPLTVLNHEVAGGGLGTAILQGANTYTGGTVIGAGDFSKQFRLVVQSNLGLGGEVLLRGGATLQLDINTAIGADQTLVVEEFALDGSVDLNFIGIATIAGLSLDGGLTFEENGTYGAIDSGATFESALFTGTGMLEVVPEPGTWALLVLGGGVLFLATRTRRAVR